MTLYGGSSVEFMKNMEENSVDVVFLDPMFPHSGKNAQVKKSMQYFREMVGKDEDAEELLAPALIAATYRVVVKRPKKSPFLDGQKPTISHEGKANRFDIYVNKSMKD
jgi:16S rRNA (guanine1516-N2)-methyltransferase